MTASPIVHAGIDEAGYGPTLGPLLICTTRAEVAGDDPWEPFRAAGIPLADSKLIHRAGDLAPLEAVALAGLRSCGFPATATAAELFAACDTRGGDPPWLAEADDLTLPVAATGIPAWELPALGAPAWRACIVQARALNDAGTAGINKAALELEVVTGFVRWHLAGGRGGAIVCDRLGGRRYYAEALAGRRREVAVAVLDEGPGESRYRLDDRWEMAFAVGGEARSPFTALASCIAKYLRELQMLLFNRYWCERIPGLRPTAGYPEDARRWLADLGPDRVADLGPDLVRGWSGPSLF